MESMQEYLLKKLEKVGQGIENVPYELRYTEKGDGVFQFYFMYDEDYTALAGEVIMEVEEGKSEIILKDPKQLQHNSEHRLSVSRFSLMDGQVLNNVFTNIKTELDNSIITQNRRAAAPASV